MEQLLTVIREYKRARRERNAASARQDFELERLYNDELTDWAARLDRVMAAEHVDIETVKALLNAKGGKQAEREKTSAGAHVLSGHAGIAPTVWASY